MNIITSTSNNSDNTQPVAKAKRGSKDERDKKSRLGSVTEIAVVSTRRTLVRQCSSSIGDERRHGRVFLVRDCYVISLDGRCFGLTRLWTDQQVGEKLGVTF